MRQPGSSLWRFANVGALATLLHVAVASLLAGWLGAHPTLANGLAFVLANAMSYVLNSRWSFRSRMSWGTWRRYMVVSLAALGLTVSLAWAAEQAGWHYLAGIALVVTAVPLLSFGAHRHFTYRVG